MTKQIGLSKLLHVDDTLRAKDTACWKSTFVFPVPERCQPQKEKKRSGLEENEALLEGLHPHKSWIDTIDSGYDHIMRKYTAASVSWMIGFWKDDELILMTWTAFLESKSFKMLHPFLAFNNLLPRHLPIPVVEGVSKRERSPAACQAGTSPLEAVPFLHLQQLVECHW